MVTGNPRERMAVYHTRPLVQWSVKSYRYRNGVLIGVTETDRPIGQAQCLRHLLGIAVQSQERLSSRARDDFDLLPCHLTNSGAKRLCHCLFGREPGCQCRDLSLGVDQLLTGVETVEEALTVPHDGMVNSIHLNDVDTRSQ
jgi:hypothetical protein